MRMKFFDILIVCTIIFGLVTVSYSGGVGTTSSSFLKIPTTSRIIGLAESVTAVIDDPSALSVNPAGLGNIENMEILFSHYEWITDIDYEYLAVAVPSFKGIKGNQGILGGSISYLHLPSFFQYGEWGERIGDLNFSSLAVTFGYGQKIGNFTIGNSIKFIREQIDDFSDITFAIDLGTIYTVKLPSRKIAGFSLKGKSLKFGAAILNIGLDGGIKGYPTPMVLKFGVGSRIAKGFLIDLDFEKPWDNRVRINLGIEYIIKGIVSVHGGSRFIGYKTDTFTLGLGISYNFKGKLARVGTAYAPQGPFKNTSIFTVSLKFPGGIPPEDWKLANTLYYKGIYYYTKGEIEKAIELWKQVLKIIPEHEKAKQKLKDAEYLLKLKEIEKEVKE